MDQLNSLQKQASDKRYEVRSRDVSRATAKGRAYAAAMLLSSKYTGLLYDTFIYGASTSATSTKELAGRNVSYNKFKTVGKKYQVRT